MLAFHEAQYFDDARDEMLRLLGQIRPELAKVDRDATVVRQAGEAYLLLASIFQAQQQFDSAIASFEKAADLLPDEVGVSIALARALRESGKILEADDALSRIESNAANNPTALHQAAQARLEADQPARAVELYRRALRARPGNALLEIYLAVAMEKQGDLQAAVQIYRKLAAVPSVSASARNNLAWILATAGDAAVRDPGQAVKLAEKLCRETQPAPSNYLDTLAAAYAAAGQFDRAAKVAERARHLAYAQGEHDLAEKLTARKNLYGDNKPYRAP